MFDMQFKNKRRYDCSWNFVHFWTFSVFVNVELFWQDARMFPKQFKHDIRYINIKWGVLKLLNGLQSCPSLQLFTSRQVRVGKDVDIWAVVSAECGEYAGQLEMWSVFLDWPAWWNCGKARGLCHPMLLRMWCWQPSHKDRAGVVLHFHHAYNLTIVSSFSVSSKPDHLVGHFSEAQRHPQKDLFQIYHVGFKRR